MFYEVIETETAFTKGHLKYYFFQDNHLCVQYTYYIFFFFFS